MDGTKNFVNVKASFLKIFAAKKSQHLKVTLNLGMRENAQTFGKISARKYLQCQ